MSFKKGCLQDKKALISKHREAPWDLQRLRGIPARIISLSPSLYSSTVSAVKRGGRVQLPSQNKGVRHGYMLLSSFFNACMN